MSYEPIDDTGRVVTLRKRFQCTWCNQWLEIGERAVTRTYKFEDALNNERMHPDCYTAMTTSIGESFDGSFEPGAQGRGLPLGVLEEAYEAENKNLRKNS